MPQLGEFGEAYKQAFESWSQLQEVIAQDPDFVDIVVDPAQQAMLIMEMIDEEAAADFAKVLTPTLDEETDRLKTNILALRENSLYGTIITEDKIQEKLAALPESPQYAETDRQLATAYFIGKALAPHRSGIVAISPLPTYVEALTDPEASIVVELPPASPELDNPNHLRIKVYTKDNMLLINDGEIAIPLARKMGTSSITAEEERLVEEYRINALKVLAAHPGEELTAKQIWDAIDKTGTPYATPAWSNYLSDFLTDDLSFNGQPLVKVRKPSPEARIRFYSLGDFSLSFEDIDAESGLLQLTNFKLPNNKVIGGRDGMVAHILLHASEKAPVVAKHLIKYGIYTAAEVRSLKYGNSLLSGAVSALRNGLRAAGVDGEFVVHRKDVGRKAAPGKRLPSGYWMELANPNESMPEISNKIEGDEVPPTSEPINDYQETDAERLESIHEAHIMAVYIAERSGLLEKLGLPILPIEILDLLELEDTSYGQEIIDQDEMFLKRARAYDKLRNLISDPSRMEEYFATVPDPDNDPRWKLIDYLDEVTADKQRKDLFEACLIAKIEKRTATHTDYNVPGRGVISIIGNDVALNDDLSETSLVPITAKKKEAEQATVDEVVPADNPSNPSDQASTVIEPKATKLTSVVKRTASTVAPRPAQTSGRKIKPKSRPLKATNRDRIVRTLDKEASEIIRAILPLIHQGGLASRAEGASWRHVNQVFPRIHIGKIRSLLGESWSNTAHLRVPEIIKLYLTTENSQLRNAFNVGYQGRALEHAIEREIQRFNEQLEEQKSAESKMANTKNS